ncbi:MAG: HD domain-containing protein [Deltaproteobacteria bacterium]|nr:HD domain-containing protein [Deltaproteobacteria bacterium]
MAEEGEKPTRFLIADNDGDFADQVVEDFKIARKTMGKSAITPIFSDTVRSSQSRLSDRDFDYAAVFVNPVLGTAAWLAVMRSCHQYRVGVPVFVIYDGKPNVSREEAEGMGAAGFIAKPLTYSKMVEMVSGNPTHAPSPDDLDPPASEEPTAARSEQEAPSGTLADGDVMEVNLANLVGRVKSAFDVYVRLSTGKFVRILKSGDVLSHDRVESYRARGVTALHILKTAQADYLNLYDALVTEVLSDKSASADIKVSQVVGQGEATARMLRDSGFGEKSVQRAQQYVANTTEMVSQLAGDNMVVKKLLGDIASLEHGVACTMLASMMLKHIGGTNPAVFNGIGIACFLHDIALLGKPPVIRDELEPRMNDEQRAIFRAHPAQSAEMLKQMKKIPPIIVSAVADHHRRMDGSGFPNAEGNVEINRVAELIGLSEEFLKVAEMSKGTPLNPFDILRVDAEKLFSAPIVDAFIRTFAEK